MLRPEERRFAYALVCGVVAAALALVGASLLSSALRGDPSLADWNTWVRGLATAIAATLGIVTGARIWHGRLGLEALHIQRASLASIALAIAAIPVLFALHVALSSLLITAAPELPATIPRDQPLLPPAHDYQRLALSLITVGLIHPVLEEILCRRYLLRLLLAFGPMIAIVASALAYGALHGWSRQGALSVVAGMVFGWLYYKSGSLVPSIVAHAGLNSSVILIYFFGLGR